jgi:hypothetical protein
MITDGQGFLDRLASSSSSGFEVNFANTATRHGFGLSLNCNELKLLCDAALCAAWCNIAFNGLGGCRGEIRSDREANRMILERKFMAARDEFCASVGWQRLAESAKESIRRIFLNIFVVGDNLAS